MPVSGVDHSVPNRIIYLVVLGIGVIPKRTTDLCHSFEADDAVERKVGRITDFRFVRRRSEGVSVRKL